MPPARLPTLPLFALLLFNATLLLLLLPALPTTQAFFTPPPSLSRAVRGGAIASSSSSSPSLSPAVAVALLTDAAFNRKIIKDQVVSALDLLEEHRQSSSFTTTPTTAPNFFSTFFPPFPSSRALPSSLLPSLLRKTGKWEIVFSSILGNGYMPSFVCEVVSLSSLPSSSSFSSSSLSSPSSSTTRRGSSSSSSSSTNYNDLPPLLPSLLRIDTSAVGGKVPLGSVLGDYAWQQEEGQEKMVFGFDTFELGPLSLPVKKKLKTYSFFWVDDKIACARSSSGGLTLMRACE